jgi:hypothetical protein
MEHTQIIGATDLESYSDTINSEAVIPELVWLLVDGTVPDLTICRIPYGDNINQPGWDGLVETETGYRQFVPKGKSYWEIGTGANPQAKATSDFEKRIKQMTPDERKDASYIVVTPRGASSGGWNEPAQRNWIKDRIDKGWKCLKILDAIQLADWLREKPAIGKWLLKRIGLVKSFAGVATPAEHWENLQQLASHADPPFPHGIFLVGRDQACVEISRLFHGEIKQMVVKVESEFDGEDFVAAYLAQLDARIRRTFNNRCLFISDPDAWLSMANLKTPHVLVAHPTLDLESSGEQLHIAAKKNGHSVIIPVSVGSTAGGCDVIPLRSPSASSLESILTNAGYSCERAGELASAGALSLAALKRYLRGLGTAAPYAKWDNARELALAGLVGRWAGENPADQRALEILLGESYGEWIEAVRPATLRLDTPLSQRNENWKVISRGEAWSALGPQLANADLDRFQIAAKVILGERDPKFDLPPDDRFAATIHGKSRLHSSVLRNGIAESLALLGSRPRSLSSCSKGKPEFTSMLVVRQLLQNADWVMWASLNDCLPLLAESAPCAFLEAVEASLEDPANTPFRELFAQEGSGLTGLNHSAGLLWALETLAWHPEHLMRVSVLLAELASIDPGGMWANRPANSLVDMFLPWHPQTCASIAKRKSAVEAILHEQPIIGWKLLLALLPSAHGATSGTRKPVWRDFIPSDWSEGVTNREYRDQVAGYAELAVNAAATDLSKLAALIDRLPDLPEPAYGRVLEHLTSECVVVLSELDRRPLWEALVDLSTKHRKFVDAKWALPFDSIARIEAAAVKLAPNSPGVIYRRLFSERECDFFEEQGSFEEQERNLERRRQAAVKEILEANELSGVLEFAKQVASPEKVGLALARLDLESADVMLLPDYLGAAEKWLLSFIGGFVWGRFWSKSWVWVDNVIGNNWTTEQEGSFLALLPFVSDAWRRAEQLLGNDVAVYWKKVRANPWQPKEHLLEAVEKLLNYDRPRAALACLNRLVQEKKLVPPELTERALLDSLTGEQLAGSLDHHIVTGLVRSLQENSDTNQDALFRIEWNYLPLLDHNYGGEPKTLERRLADQSSFFCEVLSIVFRSDKDERTDQQPTETERSIAQNAYRLLRGWKTLPGQSGDGSFDAAAFGKWLIEVKQATRLSGHLGIAMDQVGKVLAHAPKDPAGLWIHRTIAEALNAKDAKDLRSGFTCELLNRRGAYFHSAGKEELELGASFREMAEALEQHGFHRVSAAVRQIAEGYERDAERAASRTPNEE